MNYSPKGCQVWDGWYMNEGNRLHMYHIQRRRPGADVPDHVHDGIGHAITTDLIHWEELPVAFSPDASLPNDDNQPWTGCAIMHNGIAHLFYTMRGKADNGRVQHIGLATSPDGWTFTRYPQNPIIDPDPRWYSDINRPTPGLIDCRDLMVVPDPKGKGFYGFFATRVPGDELPLTSAVAVAYSPDLIHWEQRPPAFVGSRYSCLEVPNVFQLNGKWYLTCLTGNYYGNRDCFDDPNVANGTMFAVSDRPEGPYHETGDNLLLGATHDSPITVRTFTFDGETYILYTDRERSGFTNGGELTFGTISTPKLLRTRGDQLIVVYSPRIECEISGEPIGKNAPPVMRPTEKPWGQLWPMPGVRWNWEQTISGSSRSGWGIAPLGVQAESFIFEADVEIRSGKAAGLAIRLGSGQDGAVVALDAECSEVYFATTPHFDFMERRRTPIQRGTRLHLRIVNRLEHVEVYLDDEMRLSFPTYQNIGGEVGLFIDRAQAYFANVRLRTLNVNRGT